MRTFTRLVLVAGMAAFLGACSAGASTAPTVGPTQAVTVPPTEAPSATPDPCAAANLKTLTAGTLTVGADNPAYPPFFSIPDAVPSGSPWELGDPTNGKGLEGATA